MPTQMTVDEQAMVDALLRQRKGGAMDALREINKIRRRGDVDELGKTAIYRYINGATHGRGTSEARGRKKALAKKDIAKLDQVRKRLLKAADGAYRVTYEDIHQASGLRGTCCQRVVQEALRAKGVHFAPLAGR